MNICVVPYKFGTEKEIGEHLGTYHYFIEKMRTLVRKGHKVYVVAPWLSFTKKGSTEVDGVKIVRYWPPMLVIFWAWPLNKIVRWLYIKRTQANVLKTVSKHMCEVVYAYQARETGYAIAQIKNKLGVPYIFRQITAWKWHFERGVTEVFGKRGWYKKTRLPLVRNVVDPLLKMLLDARSQKKFAQTIYNTADKVVFLSKAASQEGLQAGLDPQKVKILGIAIEEDVFVPTPTNTKNTKKEILFIGRLNFSEKGIGYLIEAMPDIIKEISEAQLVVIGSGEDERARKLVHELHIEKSVSLLGKKPFSELVNYIQASDVFVVPSVWMEAFGQVTIEAMSCGVPIVTSDAGASPEINISGKTGLVVPAKDAPAMAKAVITILKDNELREKFGNAARKRVEDNYTFDVITEKFLNIVNSR